MMAGYDKMTDTIFGCKEYSMVWWHEKGHKEYNSLDFTKEIQMHAQYIFLLSIALLIVESRFWAAISFLTFLGVQILEEIYAWIYCFKHKKEWIK